MTFQEQQDLLLENYLFRYDKDEASVEFIITSICNQKCEYCYLYRYGNEMYPPEANKKENILRNLALLLDWLIDVATLTTPRVAVSEGSVLIPPTKEDAPVTNIPLPKLDIFETVRSSVVIVLSEVNPPTNSA